MPVVHFTYKTFSYSAIELMVEIVRKNFNAGARIYTFLQSYFRNEHGELLVFKVNEFTRNNRLTYLHWILRARQSGKRPRRTRKLSWWGLADSRERAHSTRYTCRSAPGALAPYTATEWTDPSRREFHRRLHLPEAFKRHHSRTIKEV